MSHRTRIRTLSACLAAWAAFAGPAAAADKPVDDVIAVVNNSVITRAELAQRIELLARQYRESGRTLPPAGPALDRQVLDRMILDRLAQQRAEELGLTVRDAELDAAIEQIAGNAGLTAKSWLAKMRAQGLTDAQIRRELRDEIQMMRLRDREVDQQVKVFDAEVDAYLAQQNAAAGVDAVRIEQLLVRVPEGASPAKVAELRAVANALRERAATASDFGKFASAQQDASGAISYSDLGLRTPDRLPQLFLDAVKPLKPGQLSLVVQSPNGFHILKLADRVAATTSTATAKQLHLRDLLIKVSAEVSDAQAQRRIVAIQAGISPKTDFAELARRLSQAPSARDGGDIGWISLAELPPEFGKVLGALSPGQVSAPVKTADGYHLLQLVESRDANVSVTQRREAARRAIRARKAEQAYADWVNQLRGSAYVQYRLDR